MSQQQQMNMAAMGGPVGGATVPQPMNAGTPTGASLMSTVEMNKRLNTAIYDYLLRTSKYTVAQAFLNEFPISTKNDIKQSPSQRNGQQVNGVEDGMDMDNDDALAKRPDGLPLPDTFGTEGPFLQDWWCQFWELYSGHRGIKGKQSIGAYISAQRSAQNQRRSIMNGGIDPSSMQNIRNYNMMSNMNGAMGAMQSDVRRAALNNQGRNLTPQQVAQMKIQGAQGMQGPQMERQGSQMDMMGPRSGSPGSGDAPSPKRAKLDGGNMQQLGQGRPGQHGPMQQGNQVGPPFDVPTPDPAAIQQTRDMLRFKGMNPDDIDQQQLHKLSLQPTDKQMQSVEIYSHSMQKHIQNTMNQSSSNMNKGMPPNMGPGVAQGSPMSQAGMDGATNDFLTAANGGRMPMTNAAAASQAGGGNGNHALQDYQMQLMLLEQQNKKRLLMARQEQDNMTHPNGMVAPGMSPQGSQRGGDPSPTPNDLQRGMIDPSQLPPNLRGQMMGNPQMRPPSSHPMSQMPQQGGQMLPNGTFPGGQMPPGQMMQVQQPGPGQPQGTPRQQNTAMPPPPAPANTGGTQPSSPAQPPAPPTPNQSNKKGGSKGEGNKKKAAANKKGANAVAAATAESEQPPTPTPATPATPVHPNSFGLSKNQQLPNGQAGAQGQVNVQANNAQQAQSQQQQNAVQPPPPATAGSDPNAPFGSLDPEFQTMSLDFGPLDGGDVLDNFDFDSFLNQDGDNFGGFDANLAFDGLGADVGDVNAS